jgi:hypothetical protein
MARKRRIEAHCLPWCDEHGQPIPAEVQSKQERELWLKVARAIGHFAAKRAYHDLQSGIPDELPPDHERREWLAVARELTSRPTSGGEVAEGDREGRIEPSKQ